MSALSADHRRIFAGFDAKVAARRSNDGFISIGTSALISLNIDIDICNLCLGSLKADVSESFNLPFSAAQSTVTGSSTT